MNWLRRWIEALIVELGDSFSRDPRALTEAERRHAAEVFGIALDPDPVRIVTAALVDTPMALGNTIRIPAGFALDPSILIHELAHVWQYQTRGAGYISNSVYHQVTAWIVTGSRSDAYRLEPADLDAASIHHLPAEKQAVIIERW